MTPIGDIESKSDRVKQWITFIKILCKILAEQWLQEQAKRQTLLRAYKGQEAVECHDCPCPEGTWHIVEEDKGCLRIRPTSFLSLMLCSQNSMPRWNLTVLSHEWGS